MNKIKRNIFIIFIFIISIGVETAHMSNIYIPRDHPTIQEGINAGENGDHIIVSDGIYTGEGNKNLTFHGKSITVRSEMGADNCIIDCQGNGRGYCYSTVGD